MRYTVNATVTFPAWLEVDADSVEEARAQAESASARDFERDESWGEVRFNVTPEVVFESPVRSVPDQEEK